MMATITDKITAGFPHPTVTPIVGQPSYATIAELNLQLNANAASVLSNLGDGHHGLLSLTVTTEVYNTISNVIFLVPTNPGANPTIPPASTGPQISEYRRQHIEDSCVFWEYMSTDASLK